MAFSFLYLGFRALLGALVRSRRGLDVKDVELLVLRHELPRRRLTHGTIIGALHVPSTGPAIYSSWETRPRYR